MKTIIEMAREANVSIRGHYDENGLTPQELERFAALVRDDEREACIVDIQLCIPRSGHSTPEIVFAKKAIDKIRVRGSK